MGILDGDDELVEDQQDPSISDVGEDSDEATDEDLDSSDEAGEESTGTEESDELVDAPKDEVSKAPKWVKNLRKDYRDLQREKRQLQEQLKALQPAQQRRELGVKPTLESVKYDEDLYETALSKWYEDKRAFDEQEAKIKSEQEREAEEWRIKLSKYDELKKELVEEDFDDAEDTAKNFLSEVQYGIIVAGAKNSAKIILKIGKNPTYLRKLSAIKDPLQFAFAIAELEASMKTTGTRQAPNPERKITSGGAPKTAFTAKTDTKLEKLREHAAKTGDFTKVLEYKRQLKLKK
jgi:hypothetical protein